MPNPTPPSDLASAVEKQYFAYKVTDTSGRIWFTSGLEMNAHEKRRLRNVEQRGPFASRDEALDAQLALEGKPTWAEQERIYNERRNGK